MLVTVIHNLKDKERYNNIVTQMAFQGLKEKEYLIVPAIMNYGTPAIGIMQSHKECIRIAKKMNEKKVCIVEDDILFLNPKSLQILFHQARILPILREVDLLLTGMYDGNPNTEGLNPLNLAKVEGKVSGLFCYVVYSEFYDEFLKAEEPYQLDYWLSEKSSASIFCTYPFVALQKDGYSYNTKSQTDYNKLIGTRYKLLNN